MAYESNTISAASQIAALLATFATNLGFSVDSSTPAAPIITIPGDEDDSNSTDITVTYSISNQTISSVSVQNYILQFPAGASNQVLIRGPIIDAVALAPTKVEFVGQFSPIPYIAIIISFGTNSYRHLLLGRLEKRGRYGGGEYITGQMGPSAASGTTPEYGSSFCKYLFSGSNNGSVTVGSNGFVRVKHALAPAEYNEFAAASETLTSTSNAGKIIGGFTDAINDGYLSRSRMAYAGRTALVPINLYQFINVSGTMHLRPIGRPAGVRMVNLRDVVTPATITIGADTWRVYPAISRRSETTMPIGTSSWRSFETSYYVGYAYKE